MVANTSDASSHTGGCQNRPAMTMTAAATAQETGKTPDGSSMTDPSAGAWSMVKSRRHMSRDRRR
jgi:hypothetical protein